MDQHYICSRYPGTDYYEFEAALPAMQPGDSVRVTMQEDGTFGVVPMLRLVLLDGIAHPLSRRLWVDADSEQENDR